MNWETEGSSTNLDGFLLKLEPGWSGNHLSRVIDAQNLVVGQEQLNTQDESGTVGIDAESQGDSTGDNVGIYSIAGFSTSRNVAGFFRAFQDSTTSPGTNVGVLSGGGHYNETGIGGGLVRPSAPEIGGYFFTGGDYNPLPQLATSSALIADNGNVAVPVFIGKVDGANAFTITSTGGILNQPSANATNAWQIDNASGTPFFDLDSTNGRVGIGTISPQYALDIQCNSALWQSVYGTEDNLILYLPFSEATGTVAYDHSPSGNDATFNSGLLWTSGKYGSAVAFATSTAGSGATQSNLVSGDLGNFSVTFWINKTATTCSGICLIVGQGYFGSWSGFRIEQVSGTDAYEFVLGDDSAHYPALATTNTGTDGQWHYMAFVVNGSTMSAYQDGVLIASGTTTSLAPGFDGNVTGAWPLYIAGRNSADTAFSMDELKIYTRALSPDEIKAEYLRTGTPNVVQGVFRVLASTTESTKLTVTNSGNTGIGTPNPYSQLQVTGPDAASSTSAFAVVNSASTTVFAVFDGGNAELSGSLSQSSDQRLKTNIQSLNASSSLSLIDQLNPITFNWADPNQTQAPQLGFIAQQVLPIFPNLVSTTSPTTLTPDGTLSLNYIGLISPIVSAIQELSSELTSIENTIAGFADSFTTKQLTFDRAIGNKIDANELCANKSDGTPVCVTGDQLAALLSQSGAAAIANPTPAHGGSSASSNLANSSPAGSATSTPPIIQVNGANPAVVQVGSTYSDLGATITGPTADLNLGIKTYLNGTLTSNIVIDTSEAATDTIDYVATDQSGLTATSTRTILVEAPALPTPDLVSNLDAGSATSTSATSTSQTDTASSTPPVENNPTTTSTTTAQ